MKRASEMVGRLLDDARSGPVKGRVCLRDRVETLREMLKDAVNESTLNLELPDADIHILAAPQAFERVLTNLVANAGDTASRDEGTVDVQFDRVLYADNSNTYVRMRVRDNGNGIDQAILEGLFDPLMTTKAAGYGLGLASVQRILEDHATAFVELKTYFPGPKNDQGPREGALYWQRARYALFLVANITH